MLIHIAEGGRKYKEFICESFGTHRFAFDCLTHLIFSRFIACVRLVPDFRSPHHPPHHHSFLIVSRNPCSVRVFDEILGGIGAGPRAQPPLPTRTRKLQVLDSRVQSVAHHHHNKLRLSHLPTDGRPSIPTSPSIHSKLEPIRGVRNHGPLAQYSLTSSIRRFPLPPSLKLIFIVFRSTTQVTRFYASWRIDHRSKISSLRIWWSC